MQKDYEWLTSRRYKYSKDKDSAVLAKFNAVINSDLSPLAQSFYASATNAIKAIGKEVDQMKNISRRNMMVDLVKDFVKEFNAIADLTKKHQDDNQFSTNICYKEKRIGKFYSCYLEDSKTQALSRKQLYLRMDQSIDSLLKKSRSQLQKIN